MHSSAKSAETMFFVDPIEEFYVVFMAQNLDQPGQYYYSRIV